MAEQQRRISLDVLMACWGLGTWLGVNGIFVQLPILVERLPEGWALPSSITLAIQLANIGIFIYAILRRVLPKVSDAPYIYSLLIIGFISLTLNAFLYEVTVVIGNTERSFVFLLFTFGVGLVGCTSSVLFYPYLRHFRDVYLATYLVGEGLSGLLPSLLALAQGVGEEPECVLSDDGSALWPVYSPPRFDSSLFFLLMGGLSVLSLVSFTAVDNLETFERERIASTEEDKDHEVMTGNVSLIQLPWITVFGLMACLNALYNGVMPSIQSYSCMPYGTVTYHLSATLGAMANPVACLAGVWLKPVPSKALAGMICLLLVPLSYIVTTALMSPTPPLVGQASGSALVVIAWVTTSAIVSYSRVWVYGWARQGGTRGMRACGAVTQLGSALGSVAMFLLVNYTEIFVQADACPSTDFLRRESLLVTLNESAHS